jgi:DNA polymerase-3 subunit alpha
MSYGAKSSVDGVFYDTRLIFSFCSSCEGLMCSSACLSNVVNANLLVGRYEQAKQAASAFKDVFDDDYYLEVMYHGLDKESQIIPDILKLGKELGIKVIATNDNHYSTSEDARFHEVLICMSSNRCIKDPRRISFPYGEFFFKTQQQMAEVFGPIPSVLTNTLEVAEKCDYSELRFVDEEGGVMRLPHFEVPTTKTPTTTYTAGVG